MNITDQIKTTLTLVPVDTTDPLVCTLRNQLIECDSELATLRAEVEKVTKERDAWKLISDTQQECHNRVVSERDEARRYLAIYEASDCLTTAPELRAEYVKVCAERDAALAKLEEAEETIRNKYEALLIAIASDLQHSGQFKTRQWFTGGFASENCASVVGEVISERDDLRAQLAAARAQAESDAEWLTRLREQVEVLQATIES